MNKRFDYNKNRGEIPLSYRDIGVIARKSREPYHADHNYFMPIYAERRKIWLGLTEPLENGLDELYVLYLKMRVADDRTVFVCVALWEKSPEPHEVSFTLSELNVYNSATLMDSFHDLMQTGESELFALKRPNPPPRDWNAIMTPIYFD